MHYKTVVHEIIYEIIYVVVINKRIQ